MYLDYWQLETKPFEPTSERRAFYPCESHQGALLKIRYGIESRRGTIVLAGPAGTGKTLLVSLLKQELADPFQPFVHLVFPQMPARELLAYLANQLGTAPSEPPRFTIDESVSRLEGFLIENSRQNRHATIVIDEAHLLEDCGVLETLRLLVNFQWEGRPALTLILVGQQGLLSTLRRIPSLDERVAVKTLLRPLNIDETASYVQHRLTASGATRDIFTPEAVETLHYLAHGIPQQINRLCDLSLVVGYAEGLSQVETTQIEAVSDELLTVTPA
jgi:type II secretory pathway predicted ATPase ExeA